MHYPVFEYITVNIYLPAVVKKKSKRKGQQTAMTSSGFDQTDGANRQQVTGECIFANCK